MTDILDRATAYTTGAPDGPASELILDLAAEIIRLGDENESLRKDSFASFQEQVYARIEKLTGRQHPDDPRLAQKAKIETL